MTVEICYRMKVAIEGDTIEEIRKKWEDLRLYDPGQGTEYVDFVGAYDYDTNDEVFLY